MGRILYGIIAVIASFVLGKIKQLLRLSISDVLPYRAGNIDDTEY